MQQVTDFISKLFDTRDFNALWYSGHWTSFHAWLYIVSDLLIAAAYFAISFIIIRFITGRKKRVAFNNLYFLFASFILACGLTHLVDAVIFWQPVYRFSAIIRLATATFSWITVFALIKVLPKALSLKTAGELQAEIDLRKKAEKELEAKNRQLSEAEKIGKICYGQWDLVNDRIVLSEEGYQMYGIEQGTEFTFDQFVAITHPADQDMLRNFIYKIIATRQFEEFHYRIIVNDTVKYIRVNGEIKLNSKGDIIMMVGTLQDVTEKQQSLRRIEQQNRMLMEIASIHSHNVRGPLATIMGLASMFNQQDISDPDNKLIIEGIKVASENLDTIVTEIVQKSWSIELMKKEQLYDEVYVNS